MKKINVLETFSGIGAQHSALENLKSRGLINYEVIGTSDWDVYAVQSYAAIHYPNYEKEIKDPTPEELTNFKLSQSFSIDGKKPFESINRYSDEVYTKWYKAYKATKNIGSVVDSFDRVVEEIILKNKSKIDLLTYSFPCQDLSTAGNFHGFNEGIKKHTRSGLLYEIEKLLDNMEQHSYDKKNNQVIERERERERETLLPKFLLLENVVNLVQVQHRADFDRWLQKLEKIGYKTIWGIINSHDFEMVQARRRVFALSILDQDNKIDWEQNIRDDLNDELIKTLEEGFFPTWKQTPKKVFDFDNKNTFESVWAQIKETPSRLRMIEAGKDLNDPELKKAPTVTTKQDRLPNVGRLKFVNERKDDNGVPYTDYRFITPMEAYALMGFDKKQYERAKADMLKATELTGARTNSSARERLYKQAGNSIAVNALEAIFNYVEKYNK